jgi:hypothetical protein
MNERPEHLEQELSFMRPRELPADLVDRIGSSINAGETTKEERGGGGRGGGGRGNRFLLCAICSGALAACVIVSVLMSELMPAPSSPQIGAAASAPTPNVPRCGDASLALARADDVSIRW